MPDIVATIGDPAANAYLTLEAADQAMDGYPNAVKWSNLNEATRQRLILKYTRLIDRAKAWTPKTSTQALAFPSSKDADGTIPAQVTNALLEGLDFEAAGDMLSLKRLQAEGVTTKSLLGQSSTFKTDESQLPAGSRNELEKLWRLYSAPVVVQHPHRQMFVEGLTNRSPFAGDPVRTADNGPLEQLTD